MPSPFPGMDPYLEGQVWTDFHTRVVPLIAETLLPHVLPRYVVRVEERVYFEEATGEGEEYVEPDVLVLERALHTRRSPGGIAAATPPASLTPVILPIPVPRRQRQLYLSVRDRESEGIITLLEVLSPTNKRQ